MLHRTIALAEPIDLGRSLRPLAHGRHDPTVRFAADGVWRATRTAAGAATVHYAVDAVRREIVVEAWGDGAELALEQAPAVVGATDDHASFRPEHPILARLVHDHPGLRIPRTAAVVEALVPAVLEQRVTTFEAQRSFRDLVKCYGEPAPGPADLHLPPDPEVLAGVAYYDLHVLGVEKKRADTVRRVAGNARRLDATALLPVEVARARLTEVVGVGAWTAGIVALVAFGDPDAVPIGDLHLPGMVTWALTGEAIDDDDVMLEVLAPYAGHRGRVIRLIGTAGLHPPRRAPRYAPRDYRDA
ncbi:MAG: 3-methyl-adenine glycosylase [Acidimicrobiales bacterium]|nr:3-methyl-adenine glycosylase [Acidimicrobiales bacterium]